MSEPRRLASRAVTFLGVFLVAATPQTDAQPAWTDPSPPEVQFVEVDEGVRLEVLDWGGEGRPLVLLAGLGNTAHVFGELAEELTGLGHVYGITRRGFGGSSRPESGYEVDRLGEDVAAVLDALGLDAPVLVGHSIAGQEISYIASRFPDRIAGAVYLDAAYRYAYYTPMPQERLRDLRERLDRLDPVLNGPPQTPAELGAAIEDILGDTLAEFQQDVEELMNAPGALPRAPEPMPSDQESFVAYRAWSLRTLGFALPEAELRQIRGVEPGERVGDVDQRPEIRQAVLAGSQRFTTIEVPALAIYASPHALGPWTRDASEHRAAFEAFAEFDRATTERQANAFTRGVPQSRAVLLRDAHHFLFLTHQTEVVQEIEAFLATLPDDATRR